MTRIRQSVPDFIKALNEKSEQKRRADQLRFQVLQECVSKIGRNLELEAEKRMRSFEDLTARMNDAFAAVLSTAQDEYEARSKDMELVCETISQRLTKYGIHPFCSLFSFNSDLSYFLFYLFFNHPADNLQEKENSLEVVKARINTLTQGASEVAVCRFFPAIFSALHFINILLYTKVYPTPCPP